MCERLLDGKQSYISGSRDIAEIGQASSVLQDDPDFVVFVAIESETEMVPVGEALENWSVKAIERTRQEWDGAETWAKHSGIHAAENLVRRFGS